MHPDSRSSSTCAQRAAHVVVGGVGSVGSKVVESIVRTSLAPDAGFLLERVTLVDRDVLETANLVRHEGLPGEVGRAKVDLVGERLEALAPDLTVERLRGSVFDADLLAPLDAAVAQATLVVASFDNAPALFRLNELCARHGRPLLIAEVISGGIGLWLLAAGGDPEAPCLVCLAHARGEDVRFEEQPRTAGHVDYADPQAPVREARVPADDWTCGVAAALLAGVAVAALRRDGALDERVPRLRLVALQRVEAPPSIAPFFQAPLQTTSVHAPRRADCPVCTARPVDDAAHAVHLSFFAAEAP